MIIEVMRKQYTDKSTIGELHIDNSFTGFYTLEDVARRFKILGKTAIPAGVYKADITYSDRFGRYMLLIKDVPGFTGIRVHTGNTDKDTEGCLLVGASKGTDVVTDSVKAYTSVWQRILAYIRDAMLKIDPIYIKITDTQKPRLF